MKVLILVVSDNKKKVSSTSGMSTSVVTSELLKYRVTECVPKRLIAIKEVNFKVINLSITEYKV